MKKLDASISDEIIVPLQIVAGALGRHLDEMDVLSRRGLNTTRMKDGIGEKIANVRSFLANAKPDYVARVLTGIENRMTSRTQDDIAHLFQSFDADMQSEARMAGSL